MSRRNRGWQDQPYATPARRKHKHPIMGAIIWICVIIVAVIIGFACSGAGSSSHAGTPARPVVVEHAAAAHEFVSATHR